MSSDSSLPVYIVDAFTDKAFSGNPAAVCLPAETILTTEMMQKIAGEMNLSETAFVTFLDDSSQPSYDTCSRFGLRWFTPKTEVPLCGHATLASAAVLFNCIENKVEELEFESASGILSAKKSGKLISIYLPENKPVKLEHGEADEIIKSMGLSVNPVDVQFSPTAGKLLVRLPDTFSRQSLEDLTFDIGSLLAVPAGVRIRGVIVCVRGTKDNGSIDADGRQYEFISRYFAPWVGINEDPVTGSAHTVLAPYWSTILSKKSFYARQCSPRGGDLHVTLDQGRVEISGASVIVLRGALSL